ncbi:MAG: orotate phosphoribosyltransferase, partial [Armatimonadota bacterium]
MSPEDRELLRRLHQIGCIKFGSFKLKDGRESPFYVDLRILVSHPEELRLVAQGLLRKAEGLSFDHIAGIPYAGMPLAVAASLESGLPMVYGRKERHGTGTSRLVEGEYQEGDTVLVLDDVITSGASKLEGIGQLQTVGLKVEDLVVLIDRQQGGRTSVESAGYKVHSVMTISEALDALLEDGAIGEEQH